MWREGGGKRPARPEQPFSGMIKFPSVSAKPRRQQETVPENTAAGTSQRRTFGGPSFRNSERSRRARAMRPSLSLTNEGARRCAGTASAVRKRLNAKTENAPRPFRASPDNRPPSIRPASSRPGNSRGSHQVSLQKDPAIKRLMFGTNNRQPGIGIEMVACQSAQPNRHIGKFREIAVPFRGPRQSELDRRKLVLDRARDEEIAKQFSR